MSEAQHREPGTIYEPTTIINEDKLELAPSARIDSYCCINASGGVRIRAESVIHVGSHVIGSAGLDMGPRAVVTYNCVILTSTANLAYPASSVVPADERASITGDIHLEAESFVGSGAVVAPGVTLHEGAVVAAQSYVDSDVPPWTIRYPDGSERPRPRQSPHSEDD